jgi:hypothetical protein
MKLLLTVMLAFVLVSMVVESESHPSPVEGAEAGPSSLGEAKAEGGNPGGLPQQQQQQQQQRPHGRK